MWLVSRHAMMSNTLHIVLGSVGIWVVVLSRSINSCLNDWGGKKKPILVLQVTSSQARRNLVSQSQPKAESFPQVNQLRLFLSHWCEGLLLILFFNVAVCLGASRFQGDGQPMFFVVFSCELSLTYFLWFLDRGWVSRFFEGVATQALNSHFQGVVLFFLRFFEEQELGLSYPRGWQPISFCQYICFDGFLLSVLHFF